MSRAPPAGNSTRTIRPESVLTGTKRRVATVIFGGVRAEDHTAADERIPPPMRRLSLPALRLAALGVAASAGAVLPAAVGSGSHAAAAGSSSSYSLIHDYDAYTRSSVLVRWAPCRRTSSGVSTHYIS